MRSRIARLGLLAIGALGLLGTTTPPASAHTSADIVFTGEVSHDAGLGFVGTDPGLPLVPTPTTVCDLPLQGDPAGVSTNCHVEWDAPHNRRTFGLSSVTCVITGVQGLNKQPPKTPGPFVHDCAFGGVGYVQGYCGLSGGQLTGTIVDALGQIYDFNVHYTNTEELTFTGHWHKRDNPSQHGKIVGEGTVTPTPGTGSCTNKTATRFSVVGAATMTQDLTLLPLLQEVRRGRPFRAPPWLNREQFVHRRQPTSAAATGGGDKVVHPE